MRDPALIQERFAQWAKLPSATTSEYIARSQAWNLYCDARDGLLDGTTAAHRHPDDWTYARVITLPQRAQA